MHTSVKSLEATADFASDRMRVYMEQGILGQWKFSVYPTMGLSHILMTDNQRLSNKWEIGRPTSPTHFIVNLDKMTREEAMLKLKELDDDLASYDMFDDSHTSMVNYMLKLCQSLEGVEDVVMNFYEAQQVLLRYRILFYMRSRNEDDFQCVLQGYANLRQQKCYRVNGELKQIGEILYRKYFTRGDKSEFYEQPFKDFCASEIMDENLISSEKEVWEKMATGGNKKQRVV